MYVHRKNCVQIDMRLARGLSDDCCVRSAHQHYADPTLSTFNEQALGSGLLIGTDTPTDRRWVLDVVG